MSSLAMDQPLSAAHYESQDPFATSSSSLHTRFSHFDDQLFALGPNTSPEQAKRALSAHLAETERRITEAGRLGNHLVQQRKDLADRLKEVEQHQNDEDITPELRQKLVEIEREYNEVGRESARAFLPKSRVSSNELPGSPFAGDNKRSLSPTKFESQASGSPTKLSVPNRKQRNQPSNRVHDIEFATEISTSLLQQVRNLQSMLNEKEDLIKAITIEKSKLEVESEGFHQRLRSLDESEHRYKDENWNLETQIHELLAAAKESSDREKKLTHSLNVLQLEKTTAQKELDEIKLSHAKLLEDHSAVGKHHDLELGSLRRNMTMADNERGALQRRIEELTGQNQELAKAVAHQRGRLEDRDQIRTLGEEEFDTVADNNTPEHSPPPSPTKGTPRHSMLETETLKSSLHHAHRMIQNLKGNIHREKTEKLELKRMLQDARDELETRRSELGSGNGKRARKTDSKEFKKPFRPVQLGGVRSSRSEIFMEDPNWEDDDGQRTPIRHTSLAMPGAFSDAHATGTESSDQFETANETSDAFETANERGTETEDFQTGAEDLSSDELTETEGGPGSVRGASARTGLYQAGNRQSFQSTASLSGDEYSYSDIKTPTTQPARLRLKVSRGLNRRSSRNVSEEPSFQGSPISMVSSSNNGTPQAAGQSLFAELGDLSDEESLQGTPSRSTFVSPAATPSSRPTTAKGLPAPLTMAPPVPRLAMVDSGIQTDAWEPEPATPKTALPLLAGGTIIATGVSKGEQLLDDERTSTAFEDRPLSPDFVPGQDDLVNRHLSIDDYRSSRPLSTSTYSDSSSQYDHELMEEKIAKFPSPPTSRAHTPMTSFAGLQAMSMAPLAVSSITSEHIEPKIQPPHHEAPVTPLTFSTIASEHVEPKEHPKAEALPAAILSISSISAEDVKPKEIPDAAPVPLQVSTIISEHVEPKTEPEVVPKPLAPFTLSTITSEHVEPKTEPEVVPEPLTPFTLSNITSEHVEPKTEPEVVPEPLAPFTLSTITSEHVEPKTEPEVAPEPFAPFAFSTIASEHVEPKEVHILETPSQPLSVSSIVSEHVEPIEPPATSSPLPIPVPESAQMLLAFSSIQSLDTSPIALEPPRSPRRDAVILPKHEQGDLDDKADRSIAPETPKSTILGTLFGLNKKQPTTPIIAEDETRQSVNSSPLAETPDSQRPFRELSANTNGREIRNHASGVTDESSQTTLTSEQIDTLLHNKISSPEVTEQGQRSIASSAPRDAVILGALKGRQSSDSFGSVGRARLKMSEPDFGNDTVIINRPSSIGSGRNNSISSIHPPLPTDHKQVIAAAAQRTSSSNGGLGSMGPPPRPSSATVNKANPSFRPRTPSIQGPLSPTISSKVGTTPRPLHSSSGTARVQSPNGTARSRQSSVSSFTSEIETRFNMRQGLPIPVGMDSGTDPRMINAITQTMIGEYLWKYTRKAGRGAMSENRHRRYFWVHPYTRTLYWSDRDPSTAGRAELKAKSVPIEAVRVVTDDNPMPPGLHRKSLVIMTPGRNVKFTATTGQRHETWFNALSYLLLRTEENAIGDTSEVANGALTAEDVAEFNPGYGNNASQLGRTSLSSYNSRTTRNASPAGQAARLTSRPPPNQTDSTSSRPSMAGTLSRFSNYWKPGHTNSFSSRRSRHSVSGGGSFYEASEVHDSAEDLREMIEKQDRESDRLENVRACCDGKHDVGHLHFASLKGRHGSASSAAAASSSKPTTQGRNSVNRRTD